MYLREKDIESGEAFMGYDCVSVVFNFFDDLSHSTIIQRSSPTKFNYYNAIRDYLKNSKVKEIIIDLIRQGYSIYLCSDHGSVVAKGNGKRIDKYLIDKFAKRGTLVGKESSVLLDQKKINVPFNKDKVVILPENREMFANKDHYKINHGGITVEEMVVPFIKINK